MTNSAIFSNKWQIRKLILFNALAAILLLSWLWQPTRQIWDNLDIAVFYWLNQPLAKNAFWAHVWGIGNMRPVDAGVGILLLGLLVKRDFILPAVHARRVACAFLTLIFMLLLARFSFDSILNHLNWRRASASMQLTDAVRLTQLFPNWEAHWYLKDSSKQCFPGDHASVLLIWAMLASHFARGWKLMLVWALSLFFMLPRLAAGAHWLSDDLVGGVFLALISFGWGFYSPFTARASQWLVNVTLPFFRLLAKIPLVNRLAIVAA